MTRETYSATCSSCRWAHLLIRSLEAALQLARGHASPRHVVSVSVETRRELGRVGDGTAGVCERVSGHTAR